MRVSDEIKTVVIEAYGYLWQIETDDQRIHAARRLMLSLIDKEGQREGIANTKPMDCGHPISLGVISAETGDFLFCELCDTRSRRNDAESEEVRLRAELARLKSEREWQPIETAPHNERLILAHICPHTNKWVIEIDYASHGWRTASVSNISRHSYATHWQPLPSPPTEGARHD